MAYASWSVVFGEQPSAAKWNILGTNDASFNDGTGIGDGAITPAKLTSGTGASWAWQSFTPTWTNMVVGTGGSASNEGWYIQLGKTVFWQIATTFGTTSNSFSGNAYFDLPVGASSNVSAAGKMPLGQGVYSNASSDFWPAQVNYRSGDTAVIRFFRDDQGASSLYTDLDVGGSGAPVVNMGAAGDTIALSGFYEAA